MSIHCLICGGTDNWCNGKEYAFDDTVRIDIVNEFSNKKSKKYSRYAHARCILNMLRQMCSDYDEYPKLNEKDTFYELKKIINDTKKEK